MGQERKFPIRQKSLHHAGNYKKNAVPQRYRPRIARDKCTWVLPGEFPENTGLAILGILQDFLSNPQVNTCLVDIKDVRWADPQPLLCLGLILAESRLTRNRITINLGSTQKDNTSLDHRIFLKFFAEQGFLTAFNDHAQFLCEGEIQPDVQTLFRHLAAASPSTHFLHANCIRARIIRAEHFRDDRNALQIEVEKLLKESKELSSKTAFGSDPVARDILFQKLRKILDELVRNVAEHSHAKGERSYVGVYARIREAKPPIERDALPWSDLFQKTNSTFGQRDFSPNPYAEWLELFICDIGRGLTFHIQDWELSNDHPDFENLKQAQKAPNPFLSIVHRFFRTGFSRHQRHNAERTAVTGLQHLGHILAIGGDYCRIYTQKGSWAGGHHPWPEGHIPSVRDIRDTSQKINEKYENLNPVSGTAYTFNIQPDHSNLYEGQAAWAIPDQAGRQKILETLKTQTFFESAVATEWHDRCNDHSCLPPEVDTPPASPPEVIVLRPPRLVNKQDLGKWLDLVAGDSLSPPKMPVTTFILAELSPFQALTFHELLLNLFVSRDAQLDVYLVAKNWAVSCVTTGPHSKKFISAREKATEFLNPTKTLPFSAANLAVLLRQMDSNIFWELSTDNISSPFFDIPVEWYASKNNTQAIKLKRYIDFPVALIQPERYHACLRALSRCLALYPERNAIGADDLVASLVRDAKLSSYNKSNEGDISDIVIGSIAVTAGTVNRVKKDGCNDSIQIMIHGDAKEELDTTSLCALLWIAQLPGERGLGTSSKAEAPMVQPWRRIPNTPHIAPRGEQSISILRYKRRPNGKLDFNKSLCYENTPEEMYNDFQRLGILRTGHWKYTSRHDLLTVNMRLAFQYSFLELGPLYSWLKRQFKFFFAKEKTGQSRAQLLVYPSHPVTDTMLDRIRQDSTFSAILPEGGMIPVKFLGQRTVSPLLASHLVAYRIENLVKEHEWKAWSAVVFDDGTITGKHLREITQFLQGIGATDYYTLALLDRSGLPAQEGVFDQFAKRHKRFWRWDVPGLGNKRNCPLCQARVIVQTYAQELSSARQKERLKEWMEIWKVRDVDLEWHKGCFPQTPLTPPLKITFGVDENDKGDRQEKQILLGNSNAAASLLVELTRLTPRADVTMKKAEKVAATHPDAAIEMVASQLLLFLDELSAQERRERFEKLLTFIWARSDITEATSLAGLCFTLVDIDILGDIWKICRDNLLRSKRLGNLDATIVTNILRSKYEFETKEPYKLPAEANEIEITNFIMLGVGSGLKHAISSFLVNLYRNPSNENHLSAHSTEIRKRLYILQNNNLDDTAKKETIERVIQDIELAEQIFLDFQRNLVIQGENCKLNELSSYILKLKESYSEYGINVSMKIANSLEKLLYGNQTQEGLVTEFGKIIFRQFQNDDEFDNRLISEMGRLIRQRWHDIIAGKESDKKNTIAAKRWRTNNNEIIKPLIACSTNDSFQGIWLYCDLFVREVLQDTVCNVFHASKLIRDPFNNKVSTIGHEAHLWWHIEKDKNYALVTMANATANQKIVLREKTSISGLEHAGGWIEFDFEKINDDLICFTKIHIPLHSHFIKEDQ